MFPTLASRVLAAYPCDRGDAQRQFVSALSDAFITCPSRRAARAAARTQTEPVYSYLFTHAYAAGQRMQSYWVNFASTGDPNGVGLPSWTTYVPTLDNRMQLDTPTAMATNIDDAGCDFWDTVQ